MRKGAVHENVMFHPKLGAPVSKGVAKVLPLGLSTLPRKAATAMIIAFVLGVAIVVFDRALWRFLLRKAACSPKLAR